MIAIKFEYVHSPGNSDRVNSIQSQATLQYLFTFVRSAYHRVFNGTRITKRKSPKWIALLQSFNLNWFLFSIVSVNMQLFTFLSPCVCYWNIRIALALALRMIPSNRRQRTLTKWYLEFISCTSIKCPLRTSDFSFQLEKLKKKISNHI